MKVSEKLDRIYDLIMEYSPHDEDGKLLRENVKKVLNGELPVEVDSKPHKCIYVHGVCDCGFKVEDHEKNYAPPQYDCHGIKVGSKFYNDFYK